MEPTTSQPRAADSVRTPSAPLYWIGIALLSHTAWGGYTVLARYLQNTCHIPSLSLVAMTNALAALALTVWLGSRIDWRGLLTRPMLAFAVIVILRSVTNIYAARFTLAIYVQLIALLTPFFVAALTNLLLHEPIPRYTGRAIVLSLVGSVLMVTANLGSDGLGLAITPGDGLGIGLALASSFFLALYMISIRHITTSGVSPQTMAVGQVYVLSIGMGLASVLFQEDWGAWGGLNTTGWVIFVAFAWGVVLLGTVLQNAALKHLRASFYTTIQAWRLISTALLAALMLGEWFSSIWQYVGAVAVVATITWYSQQQYTHPARSSGSA